jgi:hypothetical protein
MNSANFIENLAANSNGINSIVNFAANTAEAKGRSILAVEHNM